MPASLPSSPPLSLQSTVAPEMGITVQRTDAGTPIATVRTGPRWYQLTLVWDVEPRDDLDTLLDWLYAHRGELIECTVKGRTYHARITPPEHADITPRGPLHGRLTIPAIGTRVDG